MRSKKRTFTMVAVVLVVTTVLGLLGLFGAQVGRYDILSWKDTAKVGLELRGGVYMVYSATETGTDDFNAQMDETVRVLKDRLRTQGFTEATVKRQGDSKVRVEIPNISDPDTLLAAIGQPGKLEFREPDGTVIASGQDIIQSGYQYLTDSGYVVAFQLNKKGTEAFKEASTRLVGQEISIYLDDSLISSPSVNEAITSGEGFIDGDFTEAEARSLALIIQSGSLPLDLKQTEIRTISGNLGADALASFVKAALWSAVAVFLLLVLVYRLAGLMVTLSMGVYSVIIMYCLSLMSNAYLNLAGVAGVILGMGLALDANLMVLERLKEELTLERPARQAVSGAFKKAASTIANVNIAMLIGALIILIYASDSVKPFAYTLAASSFATLFTVFLVTRLFLNGLVQAGCTSPRLLGFSSRSCPIALRLAPSKRMKWMALVPAVLLVLGLVISAFGGLNPGLDFAGGTIYTVDLKQSFEPGDVLSLVRKSLPGAKTEVRVLVSGQTQAVIEVEKGQAEQDEKAFAAIESDLKAQYPDMTVVSQDAVGPAVEENLVSGTFITIGFLVLLFVIYIGARVGFLAGVSAAAAMLLDGTITAAAAVVFHMQLNSFIVPALLVVLGYSAMNAFVLFDRIRENLRRFGASISRSTLADNSVRETVGRQLGLAVMAVASLAIIALAATNAVSDFVLPILVGIVFSTFSAMTLTGPFWAWCGDAHERRAARRKSKKSKLVAQPKKKKAKK